MFLYIFAIVNVYCVLHTFRIRLLLGDVAVSSECLDNLVLLLSLLCAMLQVCFEDGPPLSYPQFIS